MILGTKNNDVSDDGGGLQIISGIPCICWNIISSLLL